MHSQIILNLHTLLSVMTQFLCMKSLQFPSQVLMILYQLEFCLTYEKNPYFGKVITANILNCQTTPFYLCIPDISSEQVEGQGDTIFPSSELSLRQSVELARPVYF